MLATKGTHVPAGPDWAHEVKWDGVRMLGDVAAGAGGRTLLSTRNGNNASVAWPEITTSPLGDRDILVDGEIIGLNGEGLPDFGVLQERMHVRSAPRAARLAERIPATYMIFDLMRLDGQDLTRRPLSDRRELLAGLELAGSWQVPAAYDDGSMLFDATLQQGLEGIVSKRVDSRYTFDARSPHWVKLAHRHRYSYVVAGWRPQEGTTDRLASVLVGQPTADGLLFRGRVGSGIGGAASRLLSELVKPHEVGESPFADDVPAVDAHGTHWVVPQVVIDVETLSRRPVTRLRQPSYRGVRSDLGPEDLL